MTGNRTSPLPDVRTIENTWPVTITGTPVKVAGHDARIITARDGRYVLKTCGNWTSREDAERCTQAYAFLPMHGFDHSPRIVPARDGALFSRSGGRFMYLTEFVPGKEPGQTARNYKSFGSVAAKLHSIRNFPFRCPIAPESLRAPMLAFAKTLEFGVKYAELVRALPSFGSLPAGLIHADLSLPNSRIRPDSRIVILDWDEAGTGPRVLDAAYPLLMVFLTEDLRFRKSLARAFYDAYCKRIELAKEERRLFFEAALFYALWFVRFGNPSRRWRRISHALARRDEIMSVLPRP